MRRPEGACGFNCWRKRAAWCFVSENVQVVGLEGSLLGHLKRCRVLQQQGPERCCRRVADRGIESRSASSAVVRELRRCVSASSVRVLRRAGSGLGGGSRPRLHSEIITPNARRRATTDSISP